MDRRALHESIYTLDHTKLLQLLYEFGRFEVGIMCDCVTHQGVDQLERVRAKGMVGGGDLLDERWEELWLGVNSRLESLEASDTRLGGSMERVSDDCCQHRHGTSIDIDERLRNYEIDYLSPLRQSFLCADDFQYGTHPRYEIICDMVPALVQLE